MNIFNHLIKDTEIIGVSDYNAHESQPGSPATAKVEYSFRVYCKASAITIYSPCFNASDTDKINDWIKKYMASRVLIAGQIDELEPLKSTS